MNHVNKNVSGTPSDEAIGAASSEPPKEERGEWTEDSPTAEQKRYYRGVDLLIEKLLPSDIYDGFNCFRRIAVNDMPEHNAALKAERDRTESFKNVAISTERQLLAAQAAIEKIVLRIKAADGCPNFASNEIKALSRHDLSALREHHDAIRKPLVDALEKYMVAMDGLYNHNAATRAAVVQYFGTLHPPTAIAAMASVKEGRQT